MTHHAWGCFCSAHVLALLLSHNNIWVLGPGNEWRKWIHILFLLSCIKGHSGT